MQHECDFGHSLRLSLSTKNTRSLLWVTTCRKPDCLIFLTDDNASQILSKCSQVLKNTSTEDQKCWAQCQVHQTGDIPTRRRPFWVFKRFSIQSVKSPTFTVILKSYLYMFPLCSDVLSMAQTWKMWFMFVARVSPVSVCGGGIVKTKYSRIFDLKCSDIHEINNSERETGA